MCGTAGTTTADHHLQRLRADQPTSREPSHPEPGMRTPHANHHMPRDQIHGRQHNMGSARSPPLTCMPITRQPYHVDARHPVTNRYAPGGQIHGRQHITGGTRPSPLAFMLITTNHVSWTRDIQSLTVTHLRPDTRQTAHHGRHLFTTANHWHSQSQRGLVGATCTRTTHSHATTTRRHQRHVTPTRATIWASPSNRTPCANLGANTGIAGQPDTTHQPGRQYRNRQATRRHMPSWASIQDMHRPPTLRDDNPAVNTGYTNHHYSYLVPPTCDRPHLHSHTQPDPPMTDCNSHSHTHLGPPVTDRIHARTHIQGPPHRKHWHPHPHTDDPCRTMHRPPTSCASPSWALYGIRMNYQHRAGAT